MRRSNPILTLRVAALLGGLLVAERAHAVNPLEYPDNGAVQFSRGGAWLATATDPMAVHYNPAALAANDSALSLDTRLNYNNVCFTRTDEDGEPAVLVRQNTGPPYAEYKEACNDRQAFPLAIPALSMAWRAAKKLGIGIAVVPPAAYGTANEGWPALAPATDIQSGEERLAPASYRFLTLGNQSTIVFPTASVGFEPFDDFRVGAGFVSGIAVINVFTGGISTVDRASPFDAAQEDSFSNLQVRDLFVPGIVASIHWSANRYLDLAVWGRWSDSIKAHEGDLTVNTRYYNASTGFNQPNPLCAGDSGTTCPGSALNTFGRDIVDRFEFPFPPPEVRAGVRFHMPRTGAPKLDRDWTVRNPLKDDIFDLELDGSYTANSVAEVITVRFKYVEADGTGPPLTPVGNLPPIVDQATGFKDSFGVRFGGQYNAVQDKLALMAGTWFETESQHPELMNVNPPGPTRGGVGGGVTFRQGLLDITLGYQYHWSLAMETRNGLRRANTGANATVGEDAWSVNSEPIDLPPEDRQEFRSFHIVNNGRITQHAHAIALGGLIRF